MIIISTQCFPPAQGGIEDLMYGMSATFSACGENVVVFADHDKTRQGHFDAEQDFSIFRYSGLKPVRRRTKARAIRSFCRANKGEKFNLVTDSWKSLEHLDKSLFSRILCLAHGSEIPPRPSGLKYRRIRRCFSMADYIIANSDYTARRIMPYSEKPEKIRIIHPGINRPERDTAEEQKVQQLLASRQPVLITIARLEERKGQQEMIRILPELISRFPSLLYVIAGEGSARSSLQKLVLQSGLDKHVLFAGRLDGRRKSAFLANSDVFVMPGKISGSDVEGFGIAYIEAAWFGLPSVACDCGGAAEAVLHRQTGLVCPPEEPESLRQCVLELLQDRPLRMKLGENARIRANRLLWGNRINEYRCLLEPGLISG